MRLPGLPAGLSDITSAQAAGPVRLKKPRLPGPSEPTWAIQDWFPAMAPPFSRRVGLSPSSVRAPFSSSQLRDTLSAGSAFEPVMPTEPALYVRCVPSETQGLAANRA